MAIKCNDCGTAYPNSTKVQLKGCRCGSRNLASVSNPFAPTKPQQKINIIQPTVPVETQPVAEQPPIKPVTEE
jgi:predicted  nucleic acid-binding Zn-ribbon protein